MLKFILGLLSSFFGVKDVVKDEIRRTEDISTGIDKKTIADDKEVIEDVRKSNNARAADNSALDSELRLD